MNAGVVIPYTIAVDDVERHRNYQRVHKHLDGLGFRERATGQDFGSPFSPGKARNNGVAQLSVDVDVFYFNDADSIVPHDQIVAACELAAMTPGLVFAFTHYIRLNERGTPVAYIPGSGSNGAVAISRECFDTVGGYDETFVGWGYEDLAFNLACAKRWSPRRVEGSLEHLWHPPAEGRSERDRDRAVTDNQRENLRRYETLIG